MVNPQSTTFKTSEKIGIFIGKYIKVTVVMGFLTFVTRYFTRNKLPITPTKNF